MKVQILVSDNTLKAKANAFPQVKVRKKMSLSVLKQKVNIVFLMKSIHLLLICKNEQNVSE